MEKLSKKEYNDIPVYYCQHCLSLNIRGIEGNEDYNYCEVCGSTDIESSHIEEWDTLYKNKYGKPLINK
jgi:hypothetical protein